MFNPLTSYDSSRKLLSKILLIDTIGAQKELFKFWFHNVKSSIIRLTFECTFTPNSFVYFGISPRSFALVFFKK